MHAEIRSRVIAAIPPAVYVSGPEGNTQSTGLAIDIRSSQDAEPGAPFAALLFFVAVRSSRRCYAALRRELLL